MKQLVVQSTLSSPPQNQLPEDKTQKTRLFDEGEFQFLKKEVKELQNCEFELHSEPGSFCRIGGAKTIPAKLTETLTLFDEVEHIGRGHRSINFRDTLVSLVRKLQNFRDNKKKNMDGKGKRLETH